MKNKNKNEERYIRRSSHIDNIFGLSYASFLILPRTYLSDMPTEWQEKFCKLLNEYNEIIGEMDATYDYELYVQFKKFNKFCKSPELLCNYRHPKHKDLLEEYFEKNKKDL